MVAVKPQLAFFEALGPAGMGAFDEVCRYARHAGVLVIADGKRGDIGSTARAYADAYLDGTPPRADALTVNPWLGRESMEPYLASARRNGAGIFVLVKTSNAGADVQDVTLSDGRPMWQHVAQLVNEWGEDLVGEVGLSSVCAVVGATHPRAVAEARRLMPRTIMLLPGVGAQGASVAELARAFTSGPASALVNASRVGDLRLPHGGHRLPQRRRRRSGPPPRGDLGRGGLVKTRRLAAVRGTRGLPARGDDRGRPRPRRLRVRPRHAARRDDPRHADANRPHDAGQNHDDEEAAAEAGAAVHHRAGGRHLQRHRQADAACPSPRSSSSTRRSPRRRLHIGQRIRIK